jgi:hypothetical protein
VIKVQVPELKAEDVERVRQSMEAIGAAVRTMAPLIATMLLQVGQQAAIVTRTFRDQVAYEARKREEASREQ